MVLVNVISVGGVIPFDVCELAKIGDILVSETAVDVCVLWFVGCVKLVSVPIMPVFQLCGVWCTGGGLSDRWEY